VHTKNHFLLVDSLKIFAAVLIILHHLSSYGQIAEDARELMPELMTFLFDYGRFAVQIFLVLGGYLGAQSLLGMRNLNSFKVVLKVVFNRYLRLLIPYVMALLVTIACAWLARFWVQDEFVGERETWGQFLAHLFFLQGILGLDSISAGVWYVAIDWQLYAALAILLSLFSGLRTLVWICTICTVVSLLYFNRHSEFDNYFIYFMGPYGLGILAQLVKNDPDPTVRRFATGFLALIGLIIAFTSLQDLWVRNILAYVVALALIVWGNRAYKDEKHAKAHRTVNAILWGSRRSYCAFLVHFSFILLANTLYIAWGIHQRHDGMIALELMLMVLVISWFAANFLYRWIEMPARRFKL
jgi:peptidoglycan/LPS O-acetylase OafA/YrhL